MIAALRTISLMAILIMIPAAAAAQQSSAPSCEKKYVSIQAAEKVGVRVNGIAVTGPAWYPNEEVLAKLAIDEKLAAKWKAEGKRIYSIGEGTGGLLPWLLDHGVDAYGVDFWYHSGKPFPNNAMGKAMKEYERKYGSRLIQGDAFKLSAAPLSLKTDSVDAIVSNKLINNFTDPGDQAAFVAEIIRVLKPGGDARLDFVTQRQFIEIKEAMDARFPGAKIIENSEEGIVDAFGTGPGGGFELMCDYRGGTLLIKKKKPTADLVKP